MRTAATLPLVSLALALALAAGAAAEPIPFTAFGDSLTKGFRDTRIVCERPEDNGGYPPRLELELGRRGWNTRIANQGLCGEITIQGVTRIDQVLADDPGVAVIVMEGANDVAQQLSIETALFNLSIMAGKVRAAGLVPIYATIPPINPEGSGGVSSGPLASGLRSQAAREGIVFIDAYSPLIAVPDLFASFYADPFHPNPAGYDLMTEPFVEPAIKVLRDLGLLPVGNADYCALFGPCAHGEGDCDVDAECVDGATCVSGVGAEYGLAANVDVCLSTEILNCTLPAGNPQFCSRCGPCRDGEGDCDGNRECLLGFTCEDDVGAQFGFAPGADVCFAAPPLPCETPLGSGIYCDACGPCTAGQGDCDRNSDCAPGLTCAQNVGAQFGFTPATDVCVDTGTPPPPPPPPPPPGSCPLAPGDPRFCTQCGPCSDGQGDCDGDLECTAGTTCVLDVGAQFGFTPATDVCLASVPPGCTLSPGHPRYCTQCGPCQAGEGDCDGNGECVPGTTCAQNVGASFGFSPATDVCSTPIGG